MLTVNKARGVLTSGYRSDVNANRLSSQGGFPIDNHNRLFAIPVMNAKSSYLHSISDAKLQLNI